MRRSKNYEKSIQMARFGSFTGLSVIFKSSFVYLKNLIIFSRIFARL